MQKIKEVELNVKLTGSASFIIWIALGRISGSPSPASRVNISVTDFEFRGSRIAAVKAYYTLNRKCIISPS